jgi:hypothetical protein
MQTNSSFALKFKLGLPFCSWGIHLFYHFFTAVATSLTPASGVSSKAALLLF